MVMFQSEADLVATLASHDELVRKCSAGEIPFESFCERYADFYWRCALDGHESDVDERALLEKYAQGIAPHRFIAEEILGRLCADDDAQREDYVRAGRIGSREALARLQQVQVRAAP